MDESLRDLKRFCCGSQMLGPQETCQICGKEPLEWYQDAYHAALRLIVIAQEIQQPRYDWRKRTCKECAWWAIRKATGPYAKTSGCRPFPTTRLEDPACPKFIPREEERSTDQ